MMIDTLPDQSTPVNMFVMSDELCCPPLFSAALDEDDAVELATVLKVLADPVRLRLVSMIATAPDGEVCACDLPAVLGRSQPTVSHHLSQLVKARLVDREQRGRWAWFRLRDGRLRAVVAALSVPAAAPPIDQRVLTQ